MLRLRKFKEKKLTNKNIMISFVTIIVLLITLVFSKSYAIYKMQKEFDVIKSQIGSFTNGDVKIAVLVDGKETNEFPSYETNYKIESVECTNGVTGSFDVENWQVTIADMKATSTKCTVSFNSSATNEITPINMSKKDLIALNEEYQNVAYNNLKTQLLNDTYPVGSIYMSTTDDTVEKVEEKFGGTWVKYAEDMTLVGASSSKAVNTTGGNSSVSNIDINHTHKYDKTTSGSYNTVISHTHKYDKTTSGSYNTVISHNHFSPLTWYENGSSRYVGVTNDFGFTSTNRTFFGAPVSLYGGGNRYNTTTYYTSTTGSSKGSISLGYTSTNTGSAGSASGAVSLGYTSTNTGKMSSNSSINAQDPYISVYMYKRTA